MDIPNTNKKLWIDTRLNEEEMDFLWSACSAEDRRDHSNSLAGNIFKSELIKDKDNWFYETTLKGLTERMYYDEWDNYRKYILNEDEEKPKFKMFSLWVNYQRQYEFNPIHDHTGLYSFVIFMKIPTHWKEQIALPISVNSNAPLASHFQFILGKENGEVMTFPIALSPEDEGRMLFFLAWLRHMVYPFYECEEERITISGNIDLNLEKKENADEEEENMTKMLEKHMESLKKDMNLLEKRG